MLSAYSPRTVPKGVLSAQSFRPVRTKILEKLPKVCCLPTLSGQFPRARCLPSRSGQFPRAWCPPNRSELLPRVRCPPRRSRRAPRACCPPRRPRTYPGGGECQQRPALAPPNGWKLGLCTQRLQGSGLRWTSREVQSGSQTALLPCPRSAAPAGDPGHGLPQGGG